MTDREEARLAQVRAINRDREIRYNERLRAARAEKAAEWPKERARLMRQWLRVKREAEERAEPFLLSPPPPLEAPGWWLADVRVPEERLPEPPAEEPGVGKTAHGVDPLGRPVSPAKTPEDHFREAAERQTLGGRFRAAVRTASGS